MRKPAGELRTGWTTGACAAAGARAAAERLLGVAGDPDRVEIDLPRGGTTEFLIESIGQGQGWATAAIRKDAGDDPDVTHKALIVTRVSHGAPGLRFHAGKGVGTVTQPGLPIAPGEPAINPVPRQMITSEVHRAAAQANVPVAFDVTVSVPGGEELALKTWNPRLGIVGGISILGTTGIVRPFSCAAWIASIHRGIDVARAAGLTHVMGATGATSERVARSVYDLPDIACLDMGDFAGGVLKYLRAHPVDHLTLAGGFGKFTKLAQGALDLHSSRSQVNFDLLAAAAPAGVDGEQIRNANTAAQALSIAGPALARTIAHDALNVAQGALSDAPVGVDIVITDRAGTIVARAGAPP